MLTISRVAAASAESYPAQDSPFAAVAAGAAWASTYEAVSWSPGPFEVSAAPAVNAEAHTPARRVAAVTFPSPRPAGQAALDTVTMRWHVAQSIAGLNEPLRPAVVLVHSLHPDAPMAEALARSLALRGIHAFVIDLPGYGARRRPDDHWPGIVALRHAAQGVADVRRACDAVAALPGVDPRRIVLQGSSLGSFAAAVAAGLDARHSAVMLYLGGGQMLDAIEHGQQDAAHFRAALNAIGIDAEQRAALLAPLEPLLIAARLNPHTTWLLAAANDEVIPFRHAQALAHAVGAVGLAETRFRKLAGNHYTAALALPAVADLLFRIAESADPAQFENP